MQRVDRVQQVFAALQRVKSNASAFCTNFFPVPHKLESWIDRGELFYEYRSETAFFLRNDRDCWRVYFCATNAGELKQGLMNLPDVKTKPMIMDLIEREGAPESLLPIMEAAGFKFYSRLRRLARRGSPDSKPPYSDDFQAVYADKEDAQAVFDLLAMSFDHYAEQLPAIWEIGVAIRDHQILIIKRAQMLAGLLFFETQGLTSILRFWVVAEPFRGLQLGSAMMHRYFAIQNQVRRFILWVVATNESAIQKYQRYGYAPDGLVDCVLANTMVRP